MTAWYECPACGRRMQYAPYEPAVIVSSICIKTDKVVKLRRVEISRQKRRELQNLLRQQHRALKPPSVRGRGK